MAGRAIAIAAHPDDIEFLMAGTLLRLKGAGYEIHYMNLANGSCGTDSCDRETIVRTRMEESMSSAALAGAVHHGSLADDLAVFYEPRALARLSAIVREVAPEIVLTHSPDDYMEDHSNTCRLAVTAAFSRGMGNFVTEPPVAAVACETAIYHAPPHGLRDQLRRLFEPDLYVDISSVLDLKSKMLESHQSQREWLDRSQGMGSYLDEMRSMCAEIGRMSGAFRYAEAWRRHLHLGLCRQDFDPLSKALGAITTKKEAI